MPTANLTVPPEALTPLASLYRNNQLHAAAFLAHAARSLRTYPFAPLSGCATANNCLPSTARTSAPRDAPLCVLCALDRAVERFGSGMDPAVQDEYRKVGTVAKQAVIDILEANPEAEERDMVERICLALYARLHSEMLT